MFFQQTFQSFCSKMNEQVYGINHKFAHSTIFKIQFIKYPQF
jgi:hypothetical protein